MRKNWVGGLGGEWKGHDRAGHNGKSRERREVIGVGGLSGDVSRERREMMWEGGNLGRKRREGRGKRGRIPQSQDSGAVVGNALAAAEGRGGGSRWEGHTRCSCRETSGDSRGRKGLSKERNWWSRNARSWYCGRKDYPLNL